MNVTKKCSISASAYGRVLVLTNSAVLAPKFPYWVPEKKCPFDSSNLSEILILDSIIIITMDRPEPDTDMTMIQ